MNKKSIQQIKRLFTFMCALCLSLAAQRVQAQNALVTIKMQDVPMERAMNEIEKQTKYLFISPKDVDIQRLVSVDVESAPLKDALAQMVEGTDLVYQVTESNIFLSRKAAAEEQKPVTVSGTVLDEKGNPVTGASVVIAGTTSGTYTDASGDFTLQVASPARATLVINYMGYKPVEVAVGSRTALQITLQDSTVDMDAVVVTALGIKREKRAVTYNVQELKSDDFGSKDVNLMSTLAGKVAGATINTSTSGVGGSTRVVLRGVKSITGTNNPLYVIDGIPVQDYMPTQPDDGYTGAGQSGDGMSMINPDDIETISILSGAAASALYGSMAANGVVMITTKKGISGQTSVSYSNATSFFSPLKLPEFQTRYGSETGEWYSWASKMTTPSTYDARDFFQTGFNTSHALSFVTGTDKNQTYISAGATNGSGIIENNDVERYNFTARNTAKFLDDKMTLDVSFLYSKVKEQNMLSQGSYANPLVPVYLFPRADDIDKYRYYERYSVDQEIMTQFWPLGDNGLSMQNPWWIINRNMYNNNKDRYLAGVSLSYKLTDWLNVSARANLDKNLTVLERKMYASTLRVLAENSAKGAYMRRDQHTTQTYGDVMFNVNKYFGCDQWNIDANLGASFQDVVHKDYYFGGGLAAIKNLFTYGNVDRSGKLTYTQENYHERNNVAFGMASLGFRSMAYLDASLRAEWHSALAGAKQNHLLYPSVGVSLIATDIFNVKSKALNYAKLRVSYSEVGNWPRRFATIASWPVEQGQVSATTVFPLYDLYPERTYSWEAGLNLTLFNNRLRVDATVYSTETDNQLFELPISVTQSGFNRIYVNGGLVTNKGIELAASYRQPISKVDWTTSLVWSLNRNRIVSLLKEYTSPELGATVYADEIQVYSMGGVREILYEGGSMGDLYVNTMRTDEKGYIWVNSMTGAIETRKNDWIYAGNSAPKYNLAWSNSFNWKGLTAGFMVSARIGGIGVSGTQAVLDYYGVSERSAFARDNGGVVVNGGYKIDAQQWFQTVGANGTDFIGAMYVYDMTNVRLGEVSLGYDVPITQWVKWVKGFNVSLVGRNLLLFYCRAPFDPESTATTGTYGQGIDYFMQPSLRSLGFSAKVSF